jgi:hypothetical protein
LGQGKKDGSIEEDTIAALSPYITQHINRFGHYNLDLNRKPPNIDFRNINDECIELVVYGVQVRYPYELEVNERDMRFAIECAEKIEKFLKDKLMEYE